MGEDKKGEAGKGRIDTAMAGFTTATKNMQVIAGEIAKMSTNSYENSRSSSRSCAPRRAGTTSLPSRPAT